VALGRLVDALRAQGRWQRSVLIVTADHGFTTIVPNAAAPYPTIAFGRELLRAGLRGVQPVADGGVEHVYLEPGADADVLTRVAALARATPGIAEVLARGRVDGVPSLASAHPDWGLDHPRTGDLLLVAAAGHQFVDPWDPVDAGLRGNHGAPAERRIPLVVSGGWDGLTAACDAPAPDLTQVAPTVAHVLGVRMPRRLDGRATPPAPRLPVLRD
jgi:arylsulfatase A-like enzyme